MTGYEAHIVAERKQIVANGMNQRFVIAAGKVGAADRALKQYVADHCQTRTAMKKHHVTGRVSWAVPYFQGFITYRYYIALL